MKVCHSLQFLIIIGFSSVISQYIETSAIHEQTPPETSHPQNSNVDLVKSFQRPAQSRDGDLMRSSLEIQQDPSKPVLGGSLVGDIFKIEKGLMKGGKAMKAMKKIKWNYFRNLLGFLPNIYQNQDIAHHRKEAQSQQHPHHHHTHHHPHHHHHAVHHQQQVHPHQQHHDANNMVPGHHLNDGGHTSHVQTPQNHPVEKKHFYHSIQFPDITINEAPNNVPSQQEDSSEDDSLDNNAD